MQGTLTLVGMMGAGKSAVGAELARSSRVPFLDSDAEIERAAAMTIAEIFARDGEAFFREREAQVLARLLAGPAAILAVGGGAWLRAGNRALIRAAGIAVWLDAPLPVLWQRVRVRPSRPLLATADPHGTLAALLEVRRPLYAEADVTVPVAAEDSVERTAAAVRRAVDARHPGFFA